MNLHNANYRTDSTAYLLRVKRCALSYLLVFLIDCRIAFVAKLVEILELKHHVMHASIGLMMSI